MTAFQKYNYLLLILNLFEETTVKAKLTDIQAKLSNQKANIENLKNIAEQLEKVGVDADKEKIEKDFEAQYAVAEKELEKLEDIILDSDTAVEVMYAELTTQIHRSIEENSLDGVSALVRIGHKLFEGGADINAGSATYNTPLCHAIIKDQLKIAMFLLENGASANSFHFKHKPPLSIAIQEKKLEFVNLLIKYGAAIDPVRRSSKCKSPLYQAIELGEINIVKALVGNGAKLNVEVKALRGDKSPLGYALQCKQIDIARFLFDEIKKDAKLFQYSLNLFLNDAPLELLKHFVEDTSIPIESKLAISVITKINWDKSRSTVTGNSGEILLKSLLKNSENAKERLAVIKLIIQQLMTLEHLASTVEKEPCYADKELFERLATEIGEYPTKDLAQKLLKSVQIDSQQGRVSVGTRMLSEVLSYAANNQCAFSLGIKFIEKIITELDDFYKKNKCWPDEFTVNDLIEQRAEKIEFSLLNKPQATAEESLPSSVATKRFRAMAGSAIFADLNPNVPAGGVPAEAGEWYP